MAAETQKRISTPEAAIGDAHAFAYFASFCNECRDVSACVSKYAKYACSFATDFDAAIRVFVHNSVYERLPKNLAFPSLPECVRALSISISIFASDLQTPILRGGGARRRVTVSQSCCHVPGANDAKTLQCPNPNHRIICSLQIVSLLASHSPHGPPRLRVLLSYEQFDE